MLCTSGLRMTCSAHNGDMSIRLQRVTSLRRRAHANVPAASYWLCCVVDGGGHPN